MLGVKAFEGTREATRAIVVSVCRADPPERLRGCVTSATPGNLVPGAVNGSQGLNLLDNVMFAE